MYRGKALGTEMILLKDALDPNRPPTIRLHGRQVRMKASVRYLGVYWDTGLRVMSTYSELKPDKARSTEKFNALAAIAKRDWGLDHECLLIRRNIYSGSNVYNDMMVR